MRLLHALRTGDKQRPQQVDVTLDLGDIIESLGDQALEVVSGGGCVRVGEALGVQEGGVAEGLGDVQEVEAIDLEGGGVHRAREGSSVEGPVRQAAADVGPLVPELGAAIGSVLGQDLMVGKGCPPVAVEADVIHGVVLCSARLRGGFWGGVGGLGDGFALGEKVQAAELGNSAEEATVTTGEVLERPVLCGGSGGEGCTESVVVELAFAVIDGGSHSIEPGEHGS